jgi:ribosome-associated toxin RatA of RatAB toxin-antitoxin module
MITVRKSVLVAHSARSIYDLVERVEDYPNFLPWCSGSQVHNRTELGMEATVGIGLAGITQSFTTLNTHKPGQEIRLKLKEGPFSKLAGVWSFTALRADACKVELLLEYEFSSTVLEKLIGPVFDPIAASLIDAFVARADRLAQAK